MATTHNGRSQVQEYVGQVHAIVEDKEGLSNYPGVCLWALRAQHSSGQAHTYTEAQVPHAFCRTRTVLLITPLGC